MKQEYLLRNTTGRDINLGDIRYKIPAGKTKNLLSPTANLKYEEIIKSAEKGSISRYLQKGYLIRVSKPLVAPIPPQKTLADPSAIVFPQRIKSSITIGVGDVTEEIRELTISEDDELLKQLEEEGIYDGGEAPIVKKNE